MRYENAEDLKRQLVKMKKEDIRSISPEDVTDIQDIRIDKRLPPQKRILSLLEQVPNPYAYRVGETVVKVSFSGNGRTLQDCMEDYLKVDMQYPI